MTEQTDIETPFDSEAEAALDREQNRETMSLSRIEHLEHELAHLTELYNVRDLEARNLSFGLIDIENRAVSLGMNGIASMCADLRRQPAKYDASKFKAVIEAASRVTVSDDPDETIDAVNDLKRFIEPFTRKVVA